MDEHVCVGELVRDDQPDSHVSQPPAVSPQEGKGVEVHAPLHGKVLQLAEKLGAEVEGHLPVQHVVAQDKLEGLQVGARPAQVHDLRADPLLVRHLQGERGESGAHNAEEGAHVGEAHRHQVKLTEVEEAGERVPGAVGQGRGGLLLLLLLPVLGVVSLRRVVFQDQVL